VKAKVNHLFFVSVFHELPISIPDFSPDNSILEFTIDVFLNCREKNKQLAEQAAAMCCLLVQGVDDGRIKEPDDQTPELRERWRKLATERDAPSQSDDITLQQNSASHQNTTCEQTDATQNTLEKSNNVDHSDASAAVETVGCKQPVQSFESEHQNCNEKIGESVAATGQNEK
jgi:hypothetical protein